MDPDQIWVHTVCLRGFKYFSGRQNIQLFHDKINVSSVCNSSDFHEKHARLRGPNNLLTLRQIINGT